MGSNPITTAYVFKQCFKVGLQVLVSTNITVMFACCFISPLFCLQHQSNLNLNDIVYKIVINYESFALQENEDEMKMIFFSNASDKMLYF